MNYPCPHEIAHIPQPLKELEETMRSLVDTENELHFHEQALNQLHQKIVRGERVVSIHIPSLEHYSHRPRPTRSLYTTMG